MSEVDRIRCECGKLLAVFVPRGGDGSVLRIRAHGLKGARCGGSFRLYEWSDVEDRAALSAPADEHPADGAGA